VPPIESWRATTSPADASPAEASLADVSPADAPVSTAPEWPTLVDVRAANCDATARLAIVEALAAVRAPWAHAILCRAADDDTDESVRCAAASALRA
jgi:HEAT repeat protein